LSRFLPVKDNNRPYLQQVANVSWFVFAKTQAFLLVCRLRIPVLRYLENSQMWLCLHLRGTSWGRVKAPLRGVRSLSGQSASLTPMRGVLTTLRGTLESRLPERHSLEVPWPHWQAPWPP
jgi:hypothetical protein